MSRVLAIGDLHFPFVDRKKLDRIYQIATHLKPSVIIQIGDVYEFYSFSRFAKSLNFISPQTEVKKGREMALEMWSRLHSLFPMADKYQVRGNHCIRPMKQIMEKAAAYESILKEPLDALFKFPHVETMKDNREELVLDDVVYHHGWSARIGDHARYFGKSVVCGHIHRGGVCFIARQNGYIFELNAGFVADQNTLPLQYGETQMTTWVPGFGFIDELGPRFIPL